MCTLVADLNYKADVVPAPLSKTKIGGNAKVMLADSRKIMRLCDLAVMYPPTKRHLVETPDGPREICIQIGAFVQEFKTVGFMDSDGLAFFLRTDARGVRLDGESLCDFNSSAQFRALIPKGSGLIESILNIRGVETYRGSMYEYTITPGPIYLGAGKSPHFIPLEIEG